MRGCSWTAILLVAVFVAPAYAQDESAVHAAFAKEGQDIAESCAPFGVSTIGKCIYTFATANPAHVTFGSIAPANGVGVGPALVGHHTPSENLRMTWSTDAVVAPGGSWRAGGYLNFVRTAVQAPVPVFGNAPLRPAAQDVYPVYSLFAQAISLRTLPFYGEGAAPSTSRKAVWTMRQTIAGGNAVVPVGPRTFGLAVIGGATVRAFRTGARTDGSTPAIDDVFAPSEVPGLHDHRTFLELSEGVRMSPAFGVHVRPLYEFRLDEFVTSRTAHETFTRWTVDVAHEFPFYRTERPRAVPGNTPNDCSLDEANACPSPSRNRYGAATLRVMTIGSATSDGNAVPFYLQPTLGGTDIDGSPLLSSFPDSFFRAPNLFVLQATAEHSLFAIDVGHGIAIPLGALVAAEAGRVADQWSDVLHGLTHSYAAGVTIRAGGFPEVMLLYAWGPSGHHVTGTINPALLGGSARPSLF